MELVQVTTCTGSKFVHVATCKSHPVHTVCTSCNLYRFLVQVVTFTKSQLVHNIFLKNTQLKGFRLSKWQSSKLGFYVTFNSQGHIGTGPQLCHLQEFIEHVTGTIHLISCPFVGDKYWDSTHGVLN